jgi:3-phosphoshikimate 1-carboxyvinyltransferase
MRRVVEPLRRMGAKIEDTDGHGPLMLEGGRLRGVTHELPVPSAQVKSALLLAGLTAAGPTTVHQAGPARDHTERMLAAMGAEIQFENLSVTLNPTLRLSPISFRIPGDISSGAFLLVAGMLVPGSQVSVSGVGVNPTRTGLLDVLRAMGGELAIENRRSECGEPVADIKVRYSRLHGIVIEGEVVVRMIDEFPILAVAATQAQGTLVVRDAQELRVKETDRIGGIVKELHDLGAHIEEKRDGFVVEGPTALHGGVVQSHGDHRLAMSLIVAGLVAGDEVIVQDVDCIEDSFPGFLGQMREIGANLV